MPHDDLDGHDAGPGPRFAFVHRASRRFAWVEARGATLVRATGPLGDEDAVEPATKRCGSPEQASHERDRLVQKWLRQGFELEAAGAEVVGTAARLRDNAELWQVLAEAPEDDARWLVLEDWLLEVDDPRGELVRLAKAGQRTEEAQVRAALGALLLGPRHASITKRLVHPAWRAGFLRRCRFIPGGAHTADLCHAFFAAPATALLSDLELAPRELDSLTTAVVLLPGARCVRALRRLVLDAESGPGRLHLSGAQLAHLAWLEHLEVNAHCLLVGLRAPRDLVSLRYAVRDEDDLRALFEGMELPQLRRLTLHVAAIEARYRTHRTSSPALARLFENARLPALEHLEVQWASIGLVHAILDALRGGALLPTLRTLALGPRAVSPASVPGFEHLDVLELPAGVSP